MLENCWQFLQDDDAGALEAFDQAAGLKPDNALAWCGKGIALVRLGRLWEALEAFDKAINLDPERPGVWRG